MWIFSWGNNSIVTIGRENLNPRCVENTKILTNWVKRLLACESYSKFVRILRNSMQLKKDKWNDFILIIIVTVCKVLVNPNLYEN